MTQNFTPPTLAGDLETSATSRSNSTIQKFQTSKKLAAERIMDHDYLLSFENTRDWLDTYEHNPNKIEHLELTSSSTSGLRNWRVASMANAYCIALQSVKMDNLIQNKLEISKSDIMIRTSKPITSLKFGWKTNGNDATQSVPLLASGHSDGQINLWNGVTSKLITRLLSHKAPVTQILFSEDAHRLHNVQTQIISVSQDRTAKVWDFEDNGYNMSQTINFPFGLNCVAWSPNGRMVAFGGSSQKIHIYQKNIGGLIQEHKMEFLLGHLHSVINMKFWPDGSLLISASFDGRVHISDPHTGELKQILTLYYPLPNYVFPCQMLSCDLNRFGNALISLSDKGHLTIWNPMSRNIFIDEDEQQINCSPEEELQEEYSDNLTFQNCSLAFGDRYILASNFSSNNVRSISLVLPVPTLKHLCRLTIRRVVPESPKLQTLKLPPRMQNYLNYDLW